MENTELTLVPRKRKKRKRKKRYVKVLVLLLVVLLLGAGAFFVVKNYSTESVEISGNTTYTDREILRAVTAEDYVENTLAMTILNRIFRQRYLPFVEKITMSCKKPHVLTIRVKEKIRAGVFEYMDKYVYFNEEGMAMESRNGLFVGVPIVTGIEFDKLVLGEKIPVDGDYFRTIVLITKKIATYNLEIEEIKFDGDDDITLLSGNYKIYLGTNDCLEDKMSKVASVLESVSKKEKSGVIDMSLYTDEKEIITFRKDS